MSYGPEGGGLDLGARSRYHCGVANEPDLPSFDEAASRIGFLKALPPRDLERLRPYGMCRRVVRGTPVWSEGDATGDFTFVVRGRVKLKKACEAGREVIVQIVGDGALLCASAVCSYSPYCCTAVALEDAVDVVAFPRRDVLELLERSPDASRAFLREVTGRESALAKRIEELSSGQVERRLATLLLRLVEQVGVARPGEGSWIPIALSRQDLADLCATTIETAIRVMTRFAREGIVQTAARGFVVKDAAQLGRVARGESQPDPRGSET